MKKLFIIGCLMAVFALFTTESASAQCNSELYANKCLQKFTSGFTFVKSFRIDGRGGTRKKIEYTLVFSKDTNYQLQIQGKDGNAEGIIATLYDSKRDRKATSYFSNKFYPYLTYRCRATGIYYLTFTFKDSKSYCGAAALAFKR